MKSVIATVPVAVVNTVSRISVWSRYARVAGGAGAPSPACGAIFQRPLSALPSNAAKQAAESKRGRHSQSMLPSRATSADVWQSPISA